jgi:hypothetical protein
MVKLWMPVLVATAGSTDQWFGMPDLSGVEAMPQMRFLHYEKDAFLAPHTDLSRRDWRTGRRTTHTFILYLKDPARDIADGAHGGGETVLLESLKGDDLAKVGSLGESQHSATAQKASKVQI